MRNVVFANGWGANLRLEPDHNGPATQNMLYKNITGKIKSVQKKNRAGNPVNARFENVSGQ